MFSFLSPLLDVIKVVAASVTSVVLFAFASLTLAGSAVALVVSTPLFLIFSPILVPATIATTLLASGLTAGAILGTTAISLIMGLIKTAEGTSLARLAQTPLKMFKFSGGFGGSWGGKGFSGTFGNKPGGGIQWSGNIPGWLKSLLKGTPAGAAAPAPEGAAPAPAAGGATPAPAAPAAGGAAPAPAAPAAGGAIPGWLKSLLKGAGGAAPAPAAGGATPPG